MSQYQIYGIGNALVDVEVDVSDSTLETYKVSKGVMTLINELTHSHLLESLNGAKHSRTCGGSAANTIITSQQMGAQTYFSCKVANDEYGKEFLSELIKNGVKTNLDLNLCDGITGKSIIFVTPDAERSMTTYLGVSLEFSENELSENDLRDSEYLYIEGYLVAAPLGYQATLTARDLANKHRVKIALSLSDPNMVVNFSNRMLATIENQVEILFCNKQEALLFTQTDNLTDAKKKLRQIARTFVITLGAAGAVVYDGREFSNVPGCGAKVVDTTGAGDVFAGAFLYGLTRGLSYVQAAKFANYSAAKVVSKYGGRLTQSEINEVTESLNTRPRGNRK